MDIVIPYSLTQPIADINSGDSSNPATIYTSFISDFAGEMSPESSWQNGRTYAKSTYLNPVVVGYTSDGVVKIFKNISFKNKESYVLNNQNWKYIYDLPVASGYWNFQLNFQTNQLAGYVNNKDITTNSGKIYKSLINLNYSIPGSNNTWEYYDYLESHSFLRQDGKLGLTPIYKNSKFSIIKPSGVNKISLLGAENISKITVIEAPLDAVSFSQDNSLVQNIIFPGSPGLGIPDTTLISSLNNWKSCTYSEENDTLVAVGYHSGENKYLIKYNTNFVKTALMNTAIQGPPAPGSTGPYLNSYFNWQLGTIDKTDPWASNSDNLQLNKVYYSKSFARFYAIGKNLSNNRASILYSKDGISWKYCQIWAGYDNPSPVTYSTFIDIIDADEEIVACTENQLFYSSDGENWLFTWSNGPWYPNFKFHQLAYIDGYLSSERYIYATVDQGISTEGELWAFCKADNNYGLRDVPAWRGANQPAAVWTGLPRDNTNLSIYYHKYINCLLVGCLGSIKIIFRPDWIAVTQFDANTPANLNYLKTVSIPDWSTYTPIHMEYSLGSGLYLLMSSPNGTSYSVIKTITNSVPHGADTWNISGRPFETVLNEPNPVINNPIPVPYTSVWSPLGWGISISPMYSLFNIPKLGTMAFFRADGKLYYQNDLVNYTTNLDIDVDYTDYQPVININLSNNLSRVYFYIELKSNKDIGYIKNLIVGNSETIGQSQLNSSFNIIDYTKKTVDEFGNVTLIQRPYRETYDVKILIPSYRISEIYEKLVSIRNTPCLWIPAPDSRDYSYGFLTVYGFFKDFSIDIDYPEYVFCSLTIESISKF